MAKLNHGTFLVVITQYDENGIYMHTSKNATGATKSAEEKCQFAASTRRLGYLREQQTVIGKVHYRMSLLCRQVLGLTSLDGWLLQQIPSEYKQNID